MVTLEYIQNIILDLQYKDVAVTEDITFLELGMDSLSILELISNIEKDYFSKLPVIPLNTIMNRNIGNFIDEINKIINSNAQKSC
jgi:acyl carrier protein